MKKRFISCLALFLLLCLLLSSCAAGLPGHALLSTAKDKIGGFTSNVSNLLRDNLPIVLEGSSDYAIIKSKTASTQLTAAISAFCDALEGKTGVDLATANARIAKYRILIGDTGEDASKQAAEQTDAASFYIGFSDKDLVVYAHNDLMLISAFQYLIQAYIEGPNANIGEDYFFLPHTLQYTSPTLSCDGEQYLVIRADQAGERAVAAISSLLDGIVSLSGVRLSLKSDLSVKDFPDAKEILVGAPNRAECREILATLDYNEYYIGTVNQKIMILANTDLMLEKAVTDFLNSFVRAQNAQIDTKAKTIALPAVCDVRYTQKTHLIAENGLANAVIVYPNAEKAAWEPLALSLQEHVKQLTNTTLSVFSDKERAQGADDKTQILLGHTNRRVSDRVTKELKPGEWVICFEDNALLVACTGSTTARLAMQALSEKLTAQTAAISSDSIYDWGGLIQNVKRLLYLPDDLQLSDRTAPDLPATTGLTVLDEGSYLAYYKNCAASSYTTYLSKLNEANYTPRERLEMGKVKTSLYFSSDLLVTVSYAASDKTLRVVVDKREGNELPFLTENLNPRTDIDPFYAQLSDVYNQSFYGMMHVARLCDGSFLVINGGAGDRGEAQMLLDFLKKNNPLGGKPVISAWILTDCSINALSTFNAFATHFANEVTLQSVLYSFPADTQTSYGSAMNLSYALRFFEGSLAAFGDQVTVYRARTGMRYAFAGCEIETLLTLEDSAAGYRITSRNPAEGGIVLRLKLSKGGKDTQSILLLGELTERTAKLLTARYGNYLKSDVVQVCGRKLLSNATAAALYEAIAAPVVLWPVASRSPDRRTLYYDNVDWDPATRAMLKKSYAKACYVACRGTTVLTLAQLKAGAAGTVYGNGLTAPNAALGTTQTPSDAAKN